MTRPEDVTDAIRSAAWKAFHAEPSAYLDKKLAAAIAAAINASGCVLVPREPVGSVRTCTWMMMQFVYGEGSQKLAQTYVWHNGMRYFVSTIDRDSSSALGGRYAETMVWEWPDEQKERGKLVAQDEHTEGSLFAHNRMVERIRAGQLEADDDC